MISNPLLSGDFLPGRANIRKRVTKKRLVIKTSLFSNKEKSAKLIVVVGSSVVWVLDRHGLAFLCFLAFFFLAGHVFFFLGSLLARQRRQAVLRGLPVGPKLVPTTPKVKSSARMNDNDFFEMPLKPPSPRQ